MFVVWSNKITATCKDLQELRNLIEANEKDFNGWVKVRKYNGNTFVEFNHCFKKMSFLNDVNKIIRFFKGVTNENLR